MFKKVRAYLISWTYANKLHTFFMTLSDFKIQKRAAENWIYAGLLLVRLIIIFVILLKVKQKILLFSFTAYAPDLSGIAFYSLKV